MSVCKLFKKCNYTLGLLFFITISFLITTQAAFGACEVKFAGVSENGVDGFNIKGLVRPGKTAVIKFSDWSSDCVNPIKINILGSSSLDNSDPVNNYNALFSVTDSITLNCSGSICTLNLPVPVRTGFFNINFEIKDINNSNPAKKFEGIPFEISCSDGKFCNGEEQLIRDVCQAPYSASVLAPCNQRPNTGTALGGCIGTSCDCFPCDESAKTCSQFPQQAHTTAGPNPTKKNLTDAYTSTCGQGDSKNYCAYACIPDCGQGSKARVCGPDGCGGTCGTEACSSGKTCNGFGQCVTGIPTPGSCSDPYGLFASGIQASETGLIGADPAFAPISGALPSDRVSKLLALEALTNNGSGKFVKVPVTGATLTVFGNNKYGQDEVTPTSCNSPGVPEIIYQFVVSNDILPGKSGERSQGFGAVMLSETGDPAAVDTVLALHGGPGGDCRTEYKSPAANDSFCSDDSVPPGGFGSHVYGALPPGTYYLVATSYAAQAAGPYQIQIKFSDASGAVDGNGLNVCRPTTCTNRTCGFDECKFAYNRDTSNNPLFKLGRCGFRDCASGFVCSDTIGQCKAANCPTDLNNPGNYVFDCKQRMCGTDGGNCGYSCGTCASGKECNYDTNQCIPVKSCDPHAPVCPGNKQSKEHYCGYDCNWHKSSDPVFDIIPSAEGEVNPTINFQHISLPVLATQASCAIQEGCLINPASYAPGVIGDTHYILRFTTNVHNISPIVGFKPASPAKRPDLFSFSPCHGHFHFEGFARFDLLDAKKLQSGDFTPVVRGGKLAYCMEDTLQYAFSPKIECEGASSCDNQGIQAGWTDRYPADLDCQWIDLSYIVYQHQEAVLNNGAKLLDKWYSYQACVNTDRNFTESSYDNNCKQFLVYLPEELISNSTFSYENYMANAVNRNKACGTLSEPNAQLVDLGITQESQLPCVCRGDCKNVTLFDDF